MTAPSKNQLHTIGGHLSNLDSSTAWDRQSQAEFWNTWDNRNLERLGSEALRRGATALQLLDGCRLTG